MKIELKNLKHMAALSEETHCYSGTIYIDGKPAFNASNHGHGGADDYRPIAPFTYADEKRINQWLNENHPLEGQFADLDNCLEFFIGDLINEQLGRQILNRMLKTKIVVIVKDGNREALATYPAKYKPIPIIIAQFKARGDVVVNGDPELEARALKLVSEPVT
jgi:hypothetical protein